jgi:hypothetical protein
VVALQIVGREKNFGKARKQLDVVTQTNLRRKSGMVLGNRAERNEVEELRNLRHSAERPEVTEQNCQMFRS